MGMALEADEAIFENVGQAVHVAFLIMAQEATQDAPLRKALIKAMESIKLSANQRHWLDDLRGASGGSINFGGLDGNEIRAQCAMVTQAVKSRLPNPEMWVLQAKFGATEFEDVVDSAEAGGMLMLELGSVRGALVLAQLERDRHAAIAEQRRRGPAPSGEEFMRRMGQYGADMLAFHGLCERVRELESAVRSIQITIDQTKACSLVDNGRRGQAMRAPRRRYVFSAERIAAIQGLSEWFRPLFPTMSAPAIDALLAHMFANHKKLDITYRDMAKSFGGSHIKYYRATARMKAHCKQLEEMAMARLELIFVDQGVTRLLSERV